MAFGYCTSNIARLSLLTAFLATVILYSVGIFIKELVDSRLKEKSNSPAGYKNVENQALSSCKGSIHLKIYFSWCGHVFDITLSNTNFKNSAPTSCLVSRRTVTKRYYLVS
jgi:hypothetical protein